METPRTVLTIGGSDPSGAFGVFADLKTLAAHRVHGLGVLTVVSAQNSRQWLGAEYLSPEFVGRQLDAVLTDYRVDAVKTGFLGRVDLIDVVAARLEQVPARPLVVDPVLVDGRGRPMFPAEVVRAYRERLGPLATLLTPNLAEARLLLDLPPETDVEPADFLQRLAGCFPAGGPPRPVLLKGVPRNGQWGDWFCAGAAVTFLPQEWLDTPNTSGSGDTLSAAVAARLARGEPLEAAVRGGQRFTHRALAQARGWRLAGGSGPLANFAAELVD